MAFSPGFDLVKAAEVLLEDAQKLQLGLSSSLSDDRQGQDELRGRIAKAGKKIAFEAALPLEIVKAEWMVVRTCPLPPRSTKPNTHDCLFLTYHIANTDRTRKKIADVAVWNLFIHWRAFDLIPLDGSITFSELAKALDAQDLLIGKNSNSPVPTRPFSQGEIGDK